MTEHPTFAHYRMNEGKDIICEPANTKGNCIAYIVQHGDQDVLCIMEGDAFHTFNISTAGLARLSEESVTRLRQIIGGWA